MKHSFFSGIGLIFLVVIALWNSFFIITDKERAVQLRFGQIVRDSINSGVHVKVPFVDEIVIFDSRLQALDVPSERFFTLEQKAVIVDSYIKWRIDNVFTFYKATAGDSFRAGVLLVQRAESRMRNKFGGLTLNEVVSGQRDELMLDIKQSLDGVAKEELGITIVDVRVKKIDLPPQVSDSVFERMKSEREKEAQEYRSKGYEAAEGIKADADKQKRIILAEAYRKAEIIRGEGDAKSAEIYANVYKKDPEFYSFHRSLQAYRKSFNSDKDILLLEPGSDFFRYMNHMIIKNKKVTN